MQKHAHFFRVHDAIHYGPVGGGGGSLRTIHVMRGVSRICGGSFLAKFHVAGMLSVRGVL